MPLEEAFGKVLYVWFDAPIGYISATREWAAEKGTDWELYWKSNDTRLIHFIGKDNIVFHCIIFPAMLREEGSFILPDNVPAFEFLNLEGDKISTSRNWAVWLHEYLEDFRGKQDVLRYVLTTNAPETKDNDFTWKDFQTRNNSELLAIFGNFVNRTLVLTDKFFGNKVPDRVELNNLDQQVIDELETFPGRISTSLDSFRFREALSEMMNLARMGNKYLTDSEPWKQVKTDENRVQSNDHRRTAGVNQLESIEEEGIVSENADHPQENQRKDLIPGGQRQSFFRSPREDEKKTGGKGKSEECD